MKIYLYPVVTDKIKNGKNPYIDNFLVEISKHEKLVNNKVSNSASKDLLTHLFSADAYIFNWIENIAFKKWGILQFLLFILIFPILLFRRVKIIWVLHNITPHKGDTFYSKFIKKIMFKYANAIITHSEEAKFFAEANSKNLIYFINHPVPDIKLPIISEKEKKIDFLIWGVIEPYKGIVEFLKFLSRENKLQNYKIKIIGRCKNNLYENQIAHFCNENISYENRIIDFKELNEWIAISKFVLFPYLKNSISSSGALMDTIVMGGNIIGPNKGAFSDFYKQGLCLVFDNYTDILNIMEKNIALDKKKRVCFIEANSWSHFSSKIINIIKSI